MPFLSIHITSTAQHINELWSLLLLQVRMYLALEDRVDNFGHGTHVSGSIVGSSYLALGAQTPDVATGMAPGAKVSCAGAARQPLPICGGYCSALRL